MVHQYKALILLALGCSDPSSEGTEDQDIRRWTLSGRETPLESPHPQPPPFSEGRKALGDCSALPCVAEQWTSGNEKRLGLRIDSEYRFGTANWPARWPRLNGALAGCIGDPLAHPTAGNSANTRELVQVPEPYWQLTITAENPCRVKGVLRLEADGRKVVTDGLEVDGMKWREGGSERAHTLYLLHVSGQQTE